MHNIDDNVHFVPPAICCLPLGFKTHMSLEEFDVWYAKQGEFQAEWSEGMVEFTNPEYTDHNSLKGFLMSLFYRINKGRKLGRVCSSRVQIRLAGVQSRREPDLLFVKKEHSAIIQENFIAGSPDLIVEVVSPDSIERDCVVKFREYEAGRVPEYWMVDTPSRALFAYCLNEKGKYKKIAAKHGEVASHVLPGFFLRPEWLWNSIDADPDELFKEMNVL